MNIKVGAFLAAFLSLTSLGACADPRSTNALVGGGFGAAAGTIVAGAAGADPLTGALLGGGIGAAGGAILTNENQGRYGRSYGYDRPHRYYEPRVDTYRACPRIGYGCNYNGYGVPHYAPPPPPRYYYDAPRPYGNYYRY